jgi:hypothetical protein
MYYPADVLQRDGAKVFKAGTPIFLDHQTPEEKAAKPFGSVQNFAGILATDAVWDVEEQALFAEVEVFENHQSTVKALAEHVGLSIRATTRFERGERDGRSGRITSELLKARSVDLVVRAGAGGELMEALESATETQINEGTENMDEVLAAIKAQKESFDEKFAAMDKRITDVQESLVVEAVVEDAVAETEETALTVEDVKVLAASGLSEAGIDSVLAKRKLNQSLADLITAEKAYVQESAVESTNDEGLVENVEDVEESATEIRLPSAWAVKENK